jgi:DmsE family decaheme c-type cytochrome
MLESYERKCREITNDRFGFLNMPTERGGVPMKKLLLFSAACIAVLMLLPLTVSETYAQGAAQYVGADSCKQCHEDQFKSFQASIHGKKVIPGSPAAKEGCESCHGPGSIHVDKGGGKGVAIISFSKKEGAKQKSAPCLACHENSKELISWDMGGHKKMGVACDACHSGHSSKRSMLKGGQPGICLTCHKEVRADLNRQAHHPIQEGKVKCTDCHTPHGGFGSKGIKADSTPDLCYKCHAEKRGPFAYEHPPVAEDCGICHQPHGSNHSNLLKSKSPQLCQDCHDSGGHTARAYTNQHGFTGNATANKNKFFSQGCLNCHGNIHGSNRSPAFQR